MKLKQLTLKEAFQHQVDLGYTKLFFLSLKQKDFNGIVMEVLTIPIEELDDLHETFEILPRVVEDFHTPWPRLSRKKLEETV